MDSKLDNELRDSLYKSIYEEFVGPLDPSSEEVLPQWSRPTSAYSAGILYPIGSEFQEYETSSDNSSKNSPSENDDSPETEKNRRQLRQFPCRRGRTRCSLERRYAVRN